MNEQEKSLKLAELMEWDVNEFNEVDINECWNEPLSPYHGYECHSLAQFAAILLKYPEVMTLFMQVEGCGHEQCCGDVGLHTKPTQETLLDGILRMNGVDI